MFPQPCEAKGSVYKQYKLESSPLTFFVLFEASTKCCLKLKSIWSYKLLQCVSIVFIMWIELMGTKFEATVVCSDHKATSNNVSVPQYATKRPYIPNYCSKFKGLSHERIPLSARFSTPLKVIINVVFFSHREFIPFEGMCYRRRTNLLRVPRPLRRDLCEWRFAWGCSRWVAIPPLTSIKPNVLEKSSNNLW